MMTTQEGDGATFVQRTSPSATGVVMRPTNELRKHPAYAALQLSVSAAQFASLKRLGELAFKDPLLVTQQGVIIDGYARKEYADSLGISTLLCVELDISEEESLRVILNKHRRSAGWNDYNRIRMASRLKEVVRGRARANQQAGGHFKGSSKLTEANVRKEIATAAGVCEGNVTKVDQLCSVDPEVLKALASGEIRIHRAWLWRELTWYQQRERLRQHRLRELKREVSALVHKHRARTEAETKSLMPADLGHLIQGLSTLRLSDSADSESIPIVRIDAPGPIVFLTTELYELFSRNCNFSEKHN
jgi:ParB-like chromosome segregation protein Spo0J